MSHGSALKSRHLSKRAEDAGRGHEREPDEHAEPEAARVVVGHELRGQAFERVGEAGGEGHEEARSARSAPQAERREREEGENSERHPQPRPFAVPGVARGRREREHGNAAGDGQRSERLAPPDVLVELTHRDHEEEDERRPEQRLDERERRLRQRVGLSEPADDVERTAGYPARAADQAAEQRKAQGLLDGRLPRLERLHPHSERVERRGGKCSEDPGEERWHGHCGR